MVLARRDLFDVRFQILNEDGTIADEQSDLIPGVYEGGLKTWECSLDLISEIHSRLQGARQNDAAWPSGRHITEVCSWPLTSDWLRHGIALLLRATNSVQRDTQSRTAFRSYSVRLQ